MEPLQFKNTVSYTECATTIIYTLSFLHKYIDNKSINALNNSITLYHVVLFLLLPQYNIMMTYKLATENRVVSIMDFI